MVLPIPKATAALNREMQALLAQVPTVFKNYELIGTQWPAQPDFPAFPNGVATQPDGRVSVTDEISRKTKARGCHP